MIKRLKAKWVLIKAILKSQQSVLIIARYNDIHVISYDLSIEDAFDVCDVAAEKLDNVLSMQEAEIAGNDLINFFNKN